MILQGILPSLKSSYKDFSDFLYYFLFKKRTKLDPVRISFIIRFKWNALRRIFTIIAAFFYYCLIITCIFIWIIIPFLFVVDFAKLKIPCILGILSGFKNFYDCNITKERKFFFVYYGICSSFGSLRLSTEGNKRAAFIYIYQTLTRAIYNTNR